MCHSGQRWTFLSRRQRHGTTETMNRNDETPHQVNAAGRSVEPVKDPGKDERVRRERELESVS